MTREDFEAKKQFYNYLFYVKKKGQHFATLKNLKKIVSNLETCMNYFALPGRKI